MRHVVRIIFFLILAIFYILIPLDLIPDRIGLVGRIDDFAVLLLIVWWFFFKPFYDELKAKSSKNTKKPNENVSDKNTRNLSPYDVLGINEGATEAEIKSAYKILIKKYHPDLVNSMGSEIQEVAKRKTKEINEAYEQLIK